MSVIKTKGITGDQIKQKFWQNQYFGWKDRDY